MTDTTEIDGRRARRERGRLAVIDATIDLLLESGEPPTAELVAERSGVSLASLYRYFETLDAMREQAIRHYFERFSDLFDIPDIGAGPLASRIRRLVDARIHQHEVTEPVARLIRRRAGEVSQLDDALHGLRTMQSDQVHLHFADELDGTSKSVAADRVAIVATLTSFESWEQFRGVHHRGTAQIRRAWSEALTVLFDGS